MSGQDFNDMLRNSPYEAVATLIDGDSAPSQTAAPQPPAPSDPPRPSPADQFSPQFADVELKKTLAECAALDQSDTDNGKRLIKYLGRDIVVMQQAGIAGGDFLTWTGTHWDLDGGAAGAARLAQRIGDFIQLEADYMVTSPREAHAIDAGEAAQREIDAIAQIEPGDLTAKHAERIKESREIVMAGKRARASLASRKKSRRDFGVSSKNGARIDRMLAAAAPHLRISLDRFNFDPLLVATTTHTLQLVKEVDPDPNIDFERFTSRLIASRSHDRKDLITALVPVAYEPRAVAKTWCAFLERMLPDDKVRRTVQQFSGLGLLGLPIQHFMFHYGEGANGKSVFLETMVRLLGKSFAVGLPTESIIGAGDRNAGGASPDLFRLFGKRLVRILELPEGKPLQSELIKKLTGGEDIPVRTLFKGFIDFQPRAKPHMSGNGMPKITDTSNGIWRRMLFVKWPVVLAQSEQRDFEEVVSELLKESPGILNWLIAGALDYLAHGLYVAPSIAADTQEYRKEMDVVSQFFEDCVEPAPGEFVQARPMYNAFKEWCVVNVKQVIHETRFGRDLKKRCKYADGRLRKYLDVRLRDDRPRASFPSDRPPHPADAVVPL